VVRPRHLGAAVDDFEATVVVLHQGGQRLHPIAVVTVQHTLDLADLGMVDVPAHHPVGTALSCLSRHCHLKVADIADSALDFELEVARQTPVGQA